MEAVIGFVSLGAIGVINIATVAYSYGRLSNQVNGLTERVTRLETRNDTEDTEARHRMHDNDERRR